MLKRSGTIRPVTLDAASLQRAIHQLALDVATAEVVRALETAGIRSILIKGPAIARRFYDPPLLRTYGDCDLLVDPAQFHRAEAILGELGYTDIEAGRRRLERTQHASTWLRQASIAACVDLHRTLPWCDAEPGEVWNALSDQTEALTVGGHDVEVLDQARQILVMAGHAAQHDFDGKTLQDLERAAAVASVESWDEAIAVARRVGALSALLAAFRRCPACAALIPRLGEPTLEPRAAPRLVGRPPLAPGLLRLSETQGADRLRLLASKLAPSPALIRDWMKNDGARVPGVAKLDPAGTRGLVGGYALRTCWLIWQAPTGIRAWRAATRRR